MKVQFIPLDRKYIEQVRNWRNLESVSKYMYSDTHISKENQESWYKKVSIDPSCQYFLIQYLENMVGLVSFTNITDMACEWAFYLGEESAKKRGVAIPTEYLAIEHAFNTLNVSRLDCAVLSFNESVISLHKKFGFINTDIKEKLINKNNVFYDVYLFSLSKEAWVNNKQKFKKIINRFSYE